MSGRALWVPVLLAACNSHPGFPNSTADAGLADTLSTTGDAAPGAVTLTVTVRGAPAEGIAVYFQGADSALVLAATTDAQGTASAVLAAGGYVTLIEPDDGTGITRLATFAATMPGDALRLDFLPLGATDATDVTVTVPALLGAANYQVYTSCGQLTVGVSATASGELLGCGDTADIIVMANDQADAPLGSLYAAGVRVADQAVSLSGAYDLLVPTTFAYAGVPASSAVVSTYQAIATARGSLFHASNTGSVDTGRATNVLAMPATTGTTALTLSSALPAASDRGEQRVLDWGPWSSSYTLDLASAMLPAFSAGPTYEPATRTVSWTEADGGTPPDFVRARVHVFRDAIPEGRSWTWEIAAPRGAGSSVVFPRFPATGFDFGPGVTDTIDVDDLLTASVPGGYAAIRAHSFDDVPTFVSGPSGRVVAESLHSPPL